MKKTFYLLMLCWQLNPNSSFSQSCNAAGNGNLFTLLSSADSKKYITNYRNNFSKKAVSHTRTTYIARSSFLFMEHYLLNNPNVSGIKIHFIVNSNSQTRGQQDPEQIQLYFTPANDNNGKKISDFNAFKFYQAGVSAQFPVSAINTASLCLNDCDEKTKDWGPQAGTSAITIIGGGNDRILIDDESNARKYKREYRGKFCFLNRRHTKSLYMDRAVYLFIGDFLRNNPSFAGIGVYFASYNVKGLQGVKGQVRKKQITLMLTPLERTATGKIEPNFCALNDYWPKVQHKKEYTMLAPRSLNHGELCPQKCE